MEEDALFTIGEVAERAGVPVKTIRCYDEAGIFKPESVSEAGYRLYADAQLWRLDLIRSLRETGFGIRDIRQLLAGEISPGEAIALQLEHPTLCLVLKFWPCPRSSMWRRRVGSLSVS